MKIKYKLIKEYPGSPCIGTIKEVETREGRVLTCNTWELYNIYPEFWEEEKKEYDILSFKSSLVDKIATLQEDGTYKFANQICRWSKEQLYESNCVIYSIYRFSDGEVFTIGDNVYGKCGKETECRINEIMIVQNQVWFNRLDEGILLQNIRHYNPLFITEDNVAIYEENKKSCWIMDTDFNLHPYPYIGFKTFSTKQKAEEYIARNKVLFVTEDGVNIYKNDSFYFVDSYFEIGRGKAISGIFSRISDYKEFSTKEKAQEYIDMNKPLYSKNDFINAFESTDNIVKFLNELSK